MGFARRGPYSTFFLNLGQWVMAVRCGHGWVMPTECTLHVLVVGTFRLLLPGSVAPDEEECSWARRRCLIEVVGCFSFERLAVRRKPLPDPTGGECLPTKNILSALLVEPPSRTKKNIAELMRRDGFGDLRGLVSGRIESNSGSVKRDRRRVLGKLLGEACRLHVLPTTVSHKGSTRWESCMEASSNQPANERQKTGSCRVSFDRCKGFDLA